MITHDMRIVADYASRVVVLGGGRVMYSGAPGGLFAQTDLVRAARLSLPTVAQVGLRMGRDGDLGGRLLTARGFLDAAGRPAGAGVI
jgi:ABC-type multidrug transport system ATPase subunit